MPGASPQPDNSFPHVARLGLGGVLVRFADRLDDAANRAALAYRAAAEADPLPGVIETAPALGSVFLRLDAAETDPEAVIDAAQAMLATRDWRTAELPEGRRRWTIPAAFGADSAPQLDEVAEHAGTDAAGAVATLTGAALRVLTLGFAPGQPYLGTLPAAWDVPRQSGMTARIPAGAIAVAVRQAVLFTAETPTGWRQVGQTAFRCFRPEAATPVPLSPGDEVAFAEVSESELARLRARDATGDGGAEVATIA